MAGESGSRFSPLFPGLFALPFLLTFLKFRLGHSENCPHRGIELLTQMVLQLVLRRRNLVARMSF